MQDQWLTAVKRIHALAETGRSFTKDHFDAERYEEMVEITHKLMAALAGESPERIVDLVDDHTQGYVTPKVEVRGAVFHDDQLLLVKEKEDGRWALPGGYCDVGLSARENIEKEIFEEAGLETRATKLYSIRHKAKGEYDPDLRDFYKIFFLCEIVSNQLPKTGIETSEVAFFSQSDIPVLSTERVIESDIKAAWRHYLTEDSGAYFD